MLVLRESVDNYGGNTTAKQVERQQKKEVGHLPPIGSTVRESARQIDTHANVIIVVPPLMRNL